MKGIDWSKVKFTILGKEITGINEVTYSSEITISKEDINALKKDLEDVMIVEILKHEEGTPEESPQPNSPEA